MLDYLRGFWFVLHHSNRPDLKAMIVTCYLDESATDGGTPQAVVGGLQMNQAHFIGFDREWRAASSGRLAAKS